MDSMKYIGYRLIVSIIDGSAKDRDSYAFHDLKFMNKISIPKNQMKNQIGPKFKMREKISIEHKRVQVAYDA